VLCAAFIVEAFNDDRTLYDLVVRIATGALVSQVVLNVQDPGKTVSLLTLRVMLDAPFVMSVLNLSSEESFEYATELKNALKEHEASVEVFRHSLEEVKDNLRAVLNGVAEGIGYGATARRLQAPAFQAYVSGVLKDLEGAVARAGIRIADTPTLDSYYRHFTAEDEEFFFGMLGSFWNPIAQERDAASIAGVMRLRQGRSTRMSAFHQAQSVFVTQNPRVADCSARMVVSRKLAPPGEVPPAITDRFLAGLIWILYGGKAVELTRYRLIASCTAALEVRNDVMSKMNGFLRDIDETKATQFRAMMTNERAGQHLMQLTLGDSILISSTADAEQILEQLEAKLEEKHQAIARQEIAEATERAAQLVRDAEAERERQAQRMRDANANEMLVRGELDDLRRVSEREKLDRKASEELRDLETARATGELNDKLRAEREARIDEKLSLIQLSVDGARIHARRRAQSIALAAGVLSFVAALLGTEIFTQWGDSISIVGAALAGVLAVVSFWNNPQLLFDHWLRRTRDRKFAALANEYKVTNYVESFRIDWESGGVSRRPGNPVS
jgi:hypothetical protein